ncbi:MAG: sulfur carrier protein ThiS [Lachnospiraceae bacterium]|jgi:sulfur carrier protein|nr:sulfur carrier protein ThiS [Lachnospiraceae bacterium]
MVQVNGEKMEADGKILIELLTENGYQKEKIAVECNEEIVPRAEYEKKILQDGDVLEIVSFVGGG